MDQKYFFNFQNVYQTPKLECDTFEAASSVVQIYPTVVFFNFTDPTVSIQYSFFDHSLHPVHWLFVLDKKNSLKFGIENYLKHFVLY